MLLVGVALAARPAWVPAAPAQAPPDGFTWEELKDFHAWVLRPAGWGFRRTMNAVARYDFSPAVFAAPILNAKGLTIHLLPIGAGQLADATAAARIAQIASERKVLRGWTREGIPSKPLTSYGIIFRAWDNELGAERTFETVLIANQVTNTVYSCRLAAPTTEWKEVEAAGETMLASLRLDPEF